MEVLSIEPAHYFPFAIGRYEVKPGLSRFGKDFGNGKRDQQVFQRDRLARQYAADKLAARERGLHHYYATHAFDPDVRDIVCDFIEARLKVEHPSLMKAATLDPRDRFDALAMLVQEDLCVVRVEADHNWLAAAHLCFPNAWSPKEKVGKDFAAIHAPVAHIESITSAATAHVQTMVRAVDGLVRFAWGINLSDDLDRHPERITASSNDVDLERAHVRVERQTIWGLPTVRAALFTIRTYHYRCDDLSVAVKKPLADALESMSPESRAYKGITDVAEPLIARLRSASAG